MSKITEVIKIELLKEAWEGAAWTQDGTLMVKRLNLYTSDFLKACVEKIEAEFYNLEELPKEFAVNQEIIRTRNNLKSKLLEVIK